MGLSRARKLSSIRNKQLGLTDRDAYSPTRLAETKVNESAQTSKGFETVAPKSSPITHAK